LRLHFHPISTNATAAKASNETTRQAVGTRAACATMRIAVQAHRHRRTSPHFGVIPAPPAFQLSLVYFLLFLLLFIS
jgi:hypothetical protein